MHFEPQSYHFDYLEAVQEGQYKEQGKVITLNVTKPRDLNLNILKTDSTSVSSPTIEFESPAGKGKFTDIQSFLIEARDDIESAGVFSVQASSFLDKLNDMIRGVQPFVIIFRDPLGNVTLEKENTHKSVHVEFFERSWAEKKEYGLVPYSAETQYFEEEGEQKLLELIQNSSKILGLTGAGISTESGVPAFRSGKIGDEDNSWWTKHNPKDAELSSFLNDPESRFRFWKMKAELMTIIENAQPNPSHKFWVKLHSMGKLHTVITQNIDRLHTRAGLPPSSLCELHGNLLTIHCLKCNKEFDHKEIYENVRNESNPVPICSCGGLIKPDVVSFGQGIEKVDIERVMKAAMECDLMIISGTSLKVEPANTLPGIALNRGVPVVLINQGPTDYDIDVLVLLNHRPCGEIMDTIITHLDQQG